MDDLKACFHFTRTPRAILKIIQISCIISASRKYKQACASLIFSWYTKSMKNVFRVVAGRVSTWAGSAVVFLGAIVVVLVWASSGPLFHFSDTWQLVINTGTTIITFLMVFLIQNTQNRDSKAVQIKLDELIRATKGARQYYMGLEDLTDDELTELDRQFKELTAHPSTARAIQRLQNSIAVARAERKQPATHLHLPSLHLAKTAETLLAKAPAEQSHPLDSPVKLNLK